MTSENKKKQSGEKSVCRQEGLSRSRDDKGKLHQEKVASSEKESVPRDHAVNGRDSQAERGGQTSFL
jgi:hypothetical protein